MNELLNYILGLLDGIELRGYENIKRMTMAMDKLNELRAASKKITQEKAKNEEVESGDKRG